MTNRSPQANPSPAREIAQRMRSAVSVAVLTGAGMSAESGIPTFRSGDNGLWQAFEPEMLATPNAFRHDPALVWGWYQWRSAQVSRAQPHAGHCALAWMEGWVSDFHVITQNVDDLHERAGSRAVVHLHGSLFAPRCFACAREFSDETGSQPQAIDATSLAMEEHNDAPQTQLRIEPPRCRHCGGRVRPGVVWFGEQLPAAAWRSAIRAIEAADVLLVIGTSGAVQPAASLVPQLQRRRALVVEINPKPTELSATVNMAWRTGAARALSELKAACEEAGLGP